jgi:hypothetical protein
MPGDVAGIDQLHWPTLADFSVEQVCSAFAVTNVL